MAVLFHLGIECGGSRDTANEIAARLEGRLVFPDQGEADYGSGIDKDSQGNWWVTTAASGISRSGGGKNERDVRHLAELGLHWYRLLAAEPFPAFRFAQVGLEAGMFATVAELLEMNLSSASAGLVLSDEMWRRAGQPEGFVRFKDHYVWRPYEGEYVFRGRRWVLMRPSTSKVGG